MTLVKTSRATKASWAKTLKSLRLDDSAEFFWLSADPTIEDEVLGMRGTCL